MIPKPQSRPSNASSGPWVAIALLILAAPISTQAEFKRINRSNPKDPMAVQIYELANGLKVYLTQNHESPRFEAQIAVRAGSKNDPAESTGLAHYLEHMLFKGTPRIGTLDYEKEKPHLDRILELYERHFQETDAEKRTAIYAQINRESQAAAQYEIPNEMDKLYKAMGEEGLNAHTSHEETVYQVNLPANRIEQWAIIESERFQHPVFRLFQPELEIVYEEKNRTLDNKEAIIEFAVNKLLFKRHPYGQQTTIGEVEHLKNPSLKNMYEYYRKHYVPGNMAIVISGDIEPRRMLHLIDKYFSTWEARPVPPQQSWAEEPLQRAERLTTKYKGEEYALLAFRLPGRNHPDTEALKLLDMILDNATAGLINLNLNQQQRVRRAASSPELNNDFGAEYLWGIPKKGQSLKEVEDLLLDQIELIKHGKFEDWILPAIVTDYKKTRKAQSESDSARVALMRNAFLAYQEWDHVVGEIDRIERLSKQDVVRVANQYFGGGYVAGYRVDEQHEVPKIEKPQIDKIEIDPARQSEFFKRVMSMKVKEIAPRFVQPAKDYRSLDAAEGVKLYYVKNPLNDLFTLTISVDLGTRHDNRLGAATLLLDKSGSRRFGAEALKKEWYKLGTDFSIATADNETAISIAGLDENFAASWGLLTELLREPTAAPETLTELKKIILAQREDTKKDFRTIASALAQYNRYGTNSPFLRAMPNDRLAALTMDDLHGLIKSLLTYRHTVSYAGSLPLEKVLAVLREHPAEAGPLKPPPPYKFLKIVSPPRTRTVLFNKEMAQSQVRVEFGNGDYDEANVPIAQLYNDYFSGGMSGIVFQELREARALAYSVFAHYANGQRRGEQNVMVGAIGCQADKTEEAVQGLADLFENLPASKERFAETIDSVISRYRTDKLGFREIIDAVRSWERLEVPIDPRKARFAKIQHLGLADVLQFQQNHLKGRAKLISIVGDKTKFNLERLKSQGDVTEVELKDVFAF